MSSTTQAILTASQQYTIYVSFIILFSGLFGHTCNIFVLTHLKVFRSNPANFYLIAESIVNLIQMLIPFTSRIAINGFSNDLTQTSLIWCILRPAITQTSTLISLSIVCFAAIDQYLSTNYYPYLRQMSTMKAAKILLIIASTIWILHGVLIGLFFEIRSTSGCNIYNSNMMTYIVYVYYLILTGLAPITVSAFFSVLAYRNVRRIIRRQISVRRRRLDQQLTAMILVRVGFLVATTTPYVLQRIYSLTVSISNDDRIHKAVIQLIAAMTISFFYLNYSGSFYVFLFSSRRYRRQVKNILMNKCWRKNQIRQSQNLPMLPTASDALDLQSLH